MFQMVKLNNLEIILSKPNATYTAGDTVNGFLKLNSNERFKINSIYLQVEGHAKVNW